ncbi:MAG: hypothetical protein QXX08_05990 [Candidatus Bathyarchaeia archaeon]
MSEEDLADERKARRGFIRFVIIATLKVVGLALLIMSGWAFYISMLFLGFQSPILSYIAVASFWAFIILLIVVAAVIDWMKKKKAAEKP